MREPLEPLAVGRIRFEGVHEASAPHSESQPRREVAGARADVCHHHPPPDDRVDYAPLPIAPPLRPLPPEVCAEIGTYSFDLSAYDSPPLHPTTVALYTAHGRLYGWRYVISTTGLVRCREVARRFHASRARE